MDIPENIFHSIAEEISSDDSPVGIDAKKTHIMILYKLQQLEERLDKIERLVNGS